MAVAYEVRSREEMVLTMGDLDGHTAVVTGAGGGIGTAIAAALLGAGAGVVLNDRDPELLAAVNAAVAGEGRRVVAKVADVSTREGAGAVVATAVQELGGLSILVNGVGGMRGGMQRPFLEIDDQQWDFAMRLNLRTTFQCLQAAL